MKRLIVLFACFYCFFADAQNQSYQNAQIDILPMPQKVYLQVGTGINHYHGIIGLGLEVPVKRNISILVSNGIGNWGGKLGLSGRYYLKDARGKGGFSMGISRASGLEDFEIELELIDGSTASVPMELNSTLAANFAYIYAVNFKDKNKLTFSIGYSLGLNDEPYTLSSAQEISETSESIMNILAPGGLTLGIDLAFGLGNRY